MTSTATTAPAANEPASLSPAVRAALRPVDSLTDAQAVTRALARQHYENFSVVSSLLPKHLRQDFCNVYAFCRVADDLSDEVKDASDSLDALARFREQTHECYAGDYANAVFTALADTIRKHDIPILPFLDLISAFEQDQRVCRYETFAELLEYCRRSANPVGHLVLYMSGYRDAERQRLSDFTCTALQLANFWQDVRRDLIDLERIYIPAESMRRFGVTEQQLRAGEASDAFREMMRCEIERTEQMFDEGENLPPMLEGAVRRHIALFAQGGRAVLAAIRRQNFDTLSRRPSLSAWTKGRLILGAVAGKAGAGLSGLSSIGRRSA